MASIQDHGCSVIADVVVGTGASGAGVSSPQTNTVPGITVIADSFICIVSASGFDADWTTEFSAWANSNLTSITEQMDNGTLLGTGGGFGLATGICAGTTTGDSTYSQANLYTWHAVHLGIEPAGGPPPPTEINLLNFPHQHIGWPR